MIHRENPQVNSYKMNEYFAPHDSFEISGIDPRTGKLMFPLAFGVENY